MVRYSHLMMTHCNRITARFMVLVGCFVVLFLYSSAAYGQSKIPADRAIASCTQVRDWVRAWDMPRLEDAVEDIDEYSVAIVTLRVKGKVIGRGSSVSLEPSSQVLWQACSSAIAQADAKFGEQRDATWDDSIESFTKEVTVVIELSDELIPVPESMIDVEGFGTTPGIYGVVVARGEQLTVTGPYAMLMQGSDLAQSAMSLANSLSEDAGTVLLPPKELAEMGFRFYQFEPSVIGQSQSKGGMTFLDRGGRAVNLQEITIGSVDLFADQVAEFLMSRQWAGVEPLGFGGTLDPITGRNLKQFADPFEQAFGAYALLRFAKSGRSPRHQRAEQVAKQVLRELCDVLPQERRPWDSGVGASMCVIALSEIPMIEILGDEQFGVLRAKCLETLDQLYTLVDGFDASVPQGSYGLVVFALSRSSMIDDADRSGKAAAAYDRVLADVPLSLIVGQMPFLGWAAMEFEGDQKLEQMRDQILAMRSIVWDHQLQRSDLDWCDRDLAGGIVFTKGGAPLPSWQSLRPIAVLATMLGDGRLTTGTPAEGEVAVEMTKLIGALRFMKQLQAGEELSGMYTSVSQAKYGVRHSLWDQRMSIESNALALLALCEIADSFDDLLARMQSRNE